MTLLEIMLYVALATIILMALVQLYMVTVSNEARHRVMCEVEETTNIAVLQILQIIHDADAVTNLSSGESSESLTLSMLDADRNPTTVVLSGGAIVIQEGNASAVALTSSKVVISNLTFRNLSPGSSSDSIRIEFDATFDNPGERSEFDYAGTYYGTATTR